MSDQLTTNGDALRLFFTDDIYLVNEPSITWGLPQEPSSSTDVTPHKILVSEAAAPTKKEPVEFPFLGGNKRNILILVNDDDHAVSNDAGKELLRKIVKSINLVTADFALLNYAKYKGTSFQELSIFFKSNLVFSFGISPGELGLENHPSNTVVTDGGVRIVFSDELKKLDADIGVKKALWGTLQKLEI